MNNLESNALYLRKSRGDPEDESIEETLARHEKTLLEFARRSNLTITKIYNEVVSGDGLFTRPQMMQLMQDIEADKYDAVICMDIDRLGRVDTKDRGIILDTFKSHQTKIITPQKIYDLNDDLDEFSTEIQMLFARQELKKITQRLQNGMKRTVADGYHIGEPPYGYRRTYINNRPTLEICPEEAKVIQMVFDMYVNQGYGSQIIADTLNSMGLKPRKNTHFSRTTIGFYLQNPIYIGKVVWNKKHHVKKKNITDKHRSILNPESDWIVSSGVHQNIIDEELFKKAQEIRKTRSHPPSFTGDLKNPFAGLIRCKKCGNLMSRQTSKKTGPRLLCVKKSCSKSITIDKVEDAVLDILTNTLREFENNSVKVVNTNPHQTEITALTESIVTAKKQISTLTKQKDSLHDLLEQGVYDVKTFVDRSAFITEKMASLELLIKNCNNKIESLNLIPAYEEFLPTLRTLVNEYDTLSAPQKNSLMKKIITTIYYSRDNSITTLNSPFDVDVLYKQWF